MVSVKIVMTVMASCVCCLSVHAQYTDTNQVLSLKLPTDSLKVNWHRELTKNRFPVKTMLVPAALIAYGVTSLHNDGLRKINTKVKNEVYLENPHNKLPIDNFLQFAPAVAVYGLNMAGIKGKNNFRDRSMIYLMSNVILNTTVFSVKKFSHSVRPDGSNNYSFPSGHTAVAFASAEFLRQEYKEVSPWYGVAGYAMAAATGYLRMYNNKHWLSDVAAGAGIGIASTKISYWLYPKIKQTLFKDKHVNTVILPTYQSGSYGLSLVHKF